MAPPSGPQPTIRGIRVYAWAQPLGGRGSGPPKIWTDFPPQLFTYLLMGSGGGNRLRQTGNGYTFLIFFLEKGSKTPHQEIGPPTLTTWLRP